ncbi:hypothetical protein GCM10025865_01130 [Paraoerskovia sediminicola]|uniref:Phage portal protein n=1 Tax=Paraoerskovia sediminicola TaxID=1138587 RepID=A0ABM8FYJ3_9CELL|nr:phage portal protein [Paraoerskovia sediminicola]BDZ40814.1 hypothetical protein GCM10025865_01130 [Paraoerskovia sediminicola]
MVSTYGAPQVDGLDAADQDVLNGLWATLEKRRPRNVLRTRYYDSKNALRDLGIALPPQLREVEAAVGWPAKAVDSMSRRTIFDGFRAIGANTADLGLDAILDENRMDAKMPQVHTSALIHACAFTFVTNGDVEAGQPAVLITTRSALDASGVWDKLLGELSAALEIAARDSYGRAVSMVLHFHNRYIGIQWDGRRWRGFERRHRFGMLAEPIAYKAELDRPFGHSRISRPVMYLTDAAVRTNLRTEIGAEFYNAPQRYALGADEDAFADEDGNPVPAWQAILGRLLLLSRDEDGNLPQVGQFAQQTMQPNLDQMRSISQQFAGETSLPVGSLGIVQDNPASAEAIRAANEELGTEIEHWRRTSLSPAWTRQARRALAMLDDSPASRAVYATLSTQWGKWSEPSEVSQAQAAQARVTAFPLMADSDVELERAGYTRDEIDRARAEQAKVANRSNLQALLAAGQAASDAGAVAALQGS